MNPHLSSRFLGSSVIVGILLSILCGATVELLRPGYNPLRNLLGEYLVGPFNILGAAAACLLALTLLLALLGLRLSICPSRSLTASCVLVGVVIVSLCASALFPIGGPSPETHPAALASIVEACAPLRVYALLLAFLGTLPLAFKCDENWRPLSGITLVLGLLVLLFHVAFVVVPFDLRGLIQRCVAVLIFVWLLLTALRLRRTKPQS